MDKNKITQDELDHLSESSRDWELWQDGDEDTHLEEEWWNEQDI